MVPTLVIILASDVEAALDAEGADPDEGVRSWGAQGVILVTGVIVPKKRWLMVVKLIKATILDFSLF